MNKPTQEQIKEFWEWCGFKPVNHIVKIVEGLFSTCGMEDINGNRIIGDEESIDLNNLSRYAIPKLIKEYHNWKSVLHDWVDGLTGDYEKDALSLYWLLAQTMV